MPQGLEVWDAAGNKTLSISDRLSRFIGSYTIGAGAGNGSISVDLSSGTPFAIFLRDGSGTFLNFPALTVTSTGVSWAYPSGAPGTTCGGLLMYGVY